MRRPVQLGIALVAAFSILYGRADAAEYVVDPARSELVVRLYKGGIAAALAHNHVIRATEYSGEATYDPGDPSTASILIEVRSDSLVADEAAARQKYGLTKPLSDKDRGKIQSTMESAAQMDVKNYPTLKFQSTNVEKQSEGRYLITGDLTIHGVTRPVTFFATIEAEDGGMRGTASFRFKQSDFGITPYSAMLGAVRNEDEAALYLDIFAAPLSAAEAAE